MASVMASKRGNQCLCTMVSRLALGSLILQWCKGVQGVEKRDQNAKRYFARAPSIKNQKRYAGVHPCSLADPWSAWRYPLWHQIGFGAKLWCAECLPEEGRVGSSSGRIAFDVQND